MKKTISEVMNKIKFTPFPVITTECLNLTELTLEDEKEVFILKSDNDVLKFMDRPKSTTIEQARQFIRYIKDGINKNKWILWAIRLKGSEKLAGTVCLWNISEHESRADIGYELLPIFHGKGIMQEAVTAVIRYGFQTMNLHSIEAVVNADNEKSIKLLERNNFTIIKKFKEKSSFQDKISEMEVYELKKYLDISLHRKYNNKQ